MVKTEMPSRKYSLNRNSNKLRKLHVLPSRSRAGKLPIGQL